jgi:hypothetical protein
MGYFCRLRGRTRRLDSHARRCVVKDSRIVCFLPLRPRSADEAMLAIRTLTRSSIPALHPSAVGWDGCGCRLPRSR